MVGDRLYTDMRMARDTGVLAVLTLTGEATQVEVDRCTESTRPHLVVPHLGELARQLEEGRDVR
jgi:NagD protein